MRSGSCVASGGFVYRHRQLTDCFRVTATAWASTLRAGPVLFGGLYLLCFRACGFVSLAPASRSPAGSPSSVVHSRLRCSCPLEGGSHSPFLSAEASPEPPEFIWGLLTLSPELIQVLCWDFFPKDLPPFHSISLRGREGGGIRTVLLSWDFILFSCCLQHRWCEVLL